jgi:hypothetical protein
MGTLSHAVMICIFGLRSHFNMRGSGFIAEQATDIYIYIFKAIVDHQYGLKFTISEPYSCASYEVVCLSSRSLYGLHVLRGRGPSTHKKFMTTFLGDGSVRTDLHLLFSSQCLPEMLPRAEFSRLLPSAICNVSTMYAFELIFNFRPSCYTTDNLL